jgi:esterase/lipase
LQLKNGQTKELPIVLVLPGGTGPKRDYTGIASRLAEAGYAVLVLEQIIHQVPQHGANATYFVSATAVPLAIEWLKRVHGRFDEVAADCIRPKLDAIALLGHSAGAAQVRAKFQQQCLVDMLFLWTCCWTDNGVLHMQHVKVLDACRSWASNGYFHSFLESI